MQLQDAKALRPDVPTPILSALLDPYYTNEIDEHFNQFPPEVQQQYRTNNLSVTTLAKSPRQRQLGIRHAHEVTRDPLDRFWAMFGHVVHSILEDHGKESPKDLVEKRLGLVVGGYYIHGQADRLVWDEGLTSYKLQDWKLTSAMALRYGTKREYVAQLNALAYLFRKVGFPIHALENVYLFRDWSPRNLNMEQYPQSHVQVIEIPLWSTEAIESYINARIGVHHRAAGLQDDALPLCSEEELWMSDPQFRVIKADPKTGELQKKAKANCSTMLEAEDRMDHLYEEEFAKWSEKNQKLKKPKPDSDYTAPVFKIEERKAAPKRCDYCEISSFCSQRREWLMANAQSTEEEDPYEGLPD